MSYHVVPKDEPRQTQWLNALRLRSSRTESVQVCSDHFIPGDFCYDPRLSCELKFNLKKRKLNKDAVPSVFPAPIVRPPRQPDHRAQKQERGHSRPLQPEQDVLPRSEKTAAVSSHSIAVQTCPDVRSNIGTQVSTRLKDVESKSVQVCMGDRLLLSAPVKWKRAPSGDAPPGLPSTPLLPSPEVSPVLHATCQTGRRYRVRRL